MVMTYVLFFLMFHNIIILNIWVILLPLKGILLLALPAPVFIFLTFFFIFNLCNNQKRKTQSRTSLTFRW